MSKKKLFVGISLLCCLLAGCISSGCQKDEGEKIMSDEKINELEVTYFDKNNCSVMVTIDLKQGEKTRVVYAENMEEIVEPYKKLEDIETFVQEYVLARAKEKTISEENLDDQRILWRIYVRGETHNEHYTGFLEYPEYWTELIELLGEDPEDCYSVDNL